MTRDRQVLSAPVTKKSKGKSPRSHVSPVSEGNLTQINRPSVDKTEEPLANFTDKVDESYSDSCLSPEFPLVGSLPAVRGRRTSSRQTKVTSCRTPQGVKWYAVRRKISTSDGGSETQARPTVPDLARFLTSRDKTDKGCTSSDVYELQSDSRESPHRAHGKEGEAEAGLSDSDYSPVFPLPPEVTRSCANLEFLKSDGRKEDRQVASQPKKMSEVGIEKVPDTPVSRQLQSRSSEGESVVRTACSEPEKPLVSRLRSRSSESKSGVETGSEKVRDIPDELLLEHRSPKIMPSVSIGKDRSDMPEDSPVSSRLRRRSGDQSNADDVAHGKDLQATDNTEVPAVSPGKSRHHPSNRKSTVSPGDLDLASQTECSQLKQLSPDATAPDVSGSICRISDDTSFPVTFEAKLSSSKESTVSSSDLEPASQAEFTQLKQSSSAVTSAVISSNICRISDDNSFPATFEGEPSPKSSPVSSSGSPTRMRSVGGVPSPKSGNIQQMRASFQLRVNLQSPKADRVKRRSSSTSSPEDTGVSRSMSHVWTRSRSGCRSPTWTPPPSRQRQSPSPRPGSDRKLRSSSRRDSASSEMTAARRSLRLLAQTTDVAVVTTSQPDKTSPVSSPAR